MLEAAVVGFARDAVVVAPFLQTKSGAMSYILSDSAGGQSAVVDPVLDFDIVTGRVDLAAIEALMAHMRSHDLTLRWILRTSVSDARVSAAGYLKQAMGGEIAMGEQVREVDRRWSAPPDRSTGELRGAAGCDRLLADRERLVLGHADIEVLATPGPSPSCVSYLFDDAALVGELLPLPALAAEPGDVAEPDWRLWYRSLQRLLARPAATRLFMRHAWSIGANKAWQISVGQARNALAAQAGSEDAFVEMHSI